MNSDNLQVPEEVLSRWETLLEEMDVLAGELAADDIESTLLHPGSISVVSETDDFGLHVLVPNNEFRAVEELIEDGATFDEFQIYKRKDGAYVYAVVVVTDADDGVAILYPVYYTHNERGRLKADAKTHGRMRTHLRTINQQRVTLTHSTDAFFD